MNEVILTVTGNVVSDPIYRTTSNGDAFVTFRLAVNERKRTPDGAWVPGESQYFSVTAFRLLASNVAVSIQRGQLLTVTGRLRITRYQDKENVQRTSVQIDAHDIAASMKFAQVTATSCTKVQLPSNDRLGDESITAAVHHVEQTVGTPTVRAGGAEGPRSQDPASSAVEAGSSPATSDGSTGDLVAA